MSTLHARGVVLPEGEERIEHGIGMKAEHIEAMVGQGTALVPTLSILEGVKHRGDVDAPLHPLRMVGGRVLAP